MSASKTCRIVALLLIGTMASSTAAMSHRVGCGVRFENNTVVLQDAWVTAGWPVPTGVWNYPGENCTKHTYFGVYANHGCCNSTLHLRYAFDLRELLHRWSNQRVMFFGDSVTQQQIDAMVIMIYASGGSITRLPSPPSVERQSVFRINPQNVTILRSAVGGGCVSPLPNGEVVRGCTFPSSHTTFESMVAESEVVYVNIGLHIERTPKSQVQTMLEYVRDVLEHAREKRKTRHFFRLTFPQHFASPDDSRGHSFLNGHTAGCVGVRSRSDRFWTNAIALEVFRNSTTPVIDLWEFLQQRGDLHSLKQGGQADCTHYCWNLDMWNGVFYTLKYAMDVLDIGAEGAAAQCGTAKNPPLPKQNFKGRSRPHPLDRPFESWHSTRATVASESILRACVNLRTHARHSDLQNSVLLSL
jgi:hypothetical protein